MTLLIAGKTQNSAWMLADTAITGGTIELRDRVYAVKIEPTHNCSLIGFSGDHHHGQRIFRAASLLEPGDPTLAYLFEEHRKVPSVDLAYAVQIGAEPHLYRVSGGAVEEVQTLHLGVAFDHFQRIRHASGVEHAPQAIHRLLCGVTGEDQTPEELSSAVHALLTLMSSRESHDIGGWVVPYFLNANGVKLVTYAYSVSDPIMNRLSQGAVIPHGTAEGGGFGLSFAALREGDGMIVYWLQGQTGRVYIRTGSGYELHEFSGTPTEFKCQVRDSLGREIDIWFSDTPLGQPKAISYIRDEAGQMKVAVVQDGNAISFSWVGSSDDSFRASGLVRLAGHESTGELDPRMPMRLDSHLTDDKSTATLILYKNEEPLGHIVFDAAGLDQVIKRLSHLRESLASPVASEIPAGSSLEAIVDPAWRTRPAPHPSVPGPIVALRHPGFGWLAFVLPNNEAMSLGRWLVENSSPIKTEILSGE